MNVTGKVIAITGAAGGLGSGMARTLAANGAEVWLLDLDITGCRRLAEEIRAAGGRAHGARLDVTDEAGWQRIMAAVIEQSGRLDVLVNNAGINIRKPIEEMNKDEWMKMMEVNTCSVFLGCRSAIPLMRARGGGAIINTSSVCGLIGHRDTPEAYTATKGAITMFTKAVASRYGKDGIRCNSIHPSTVEPALVEKMLRDPERRAERLSEVPLGRLASVDDVANAVLYLASEEASFINGVSLPVDGGVTCY